MQLQLLSLYVDDHKYHIQFLPILLSSNLIISEIHGTKHHETKNTHNRTCIELHNIKEK